MKDLSRRARYHSITAARRAVGLLALLAVPASAQTAGQAPSATEVATELANPNTSLGALAFPIDYTNYAGTLTRGSSENGLRISFQPSLPYPLAPGVNLFVRPLIPVLITQPSLKPSGGFENRGVALGDIGFDVVVGKNFKGGWVLMAGVAGSAPTSTDSALGLHEWMFGPNMVVGYTPKWGFLGVLVSQQWDVGGSNPANTSVTGGQYFYTIGLGGGWQIQSQPVWAYSHHLDQGDRLALPLGTGVSRTIILGTTPLKMRLEYWYYVARPDPFGPRHQVRLQILPVIKLPW